MLFGEVAGSVTNRGPNVGGSPLAWLGRREISYVGREAASSPNVYFVQNKRSWVVANNKRG